MLIITISIITILASFIVSTIVYKQDKSLLKKAYTTNLIDYVLGPLLFFSAFGSIIILNNLNLPKFLTFSIASLIDGKSTSIGLSSLILNLDKTPLNLFFLLLTSIGMIFCLPAITHIEEFLFRYERLDLKSRIVKSFIFGAVHFSVGVPICSALVLSIVGFVFSIKYINSYQNAKKNSSKGIHHDIALLSSTSLHTKYNLTLFLMLVFYLSTSFLK